MFDNALQDLRAVVRDLTRNAAFTATAVAMLALGIGASTAIFSVVHGVLLRPMPLDEPHRLVWLFSSNRDQEALYERTSEADLLDWRERQTRFEALVGGQNRALTWTDPEEAKKLSVVVTTADFFQVLGARPAAGRLIEPGDEGRPVVLLTHRFWQNQFGGDPAVVGRRLMLEGTAHEVLGVLPPSFGLPRDTADIFLQRRLSDGARRHIRNFWVLGRLAEGATIASAQDEMNALAAELGREYPTSNSGWGVTVLPLQEHLTSALRPGLRTLFGAITLVLLIACANVANLQLLRATARRREIAVRLALGASRWRLARRLLLESLALGLLGGALGLLLARAALPPLLRLYPTHLPRAAEIAVDGRVLIFALAAALLTSLVCGVVPALQGSRRHLMGAIREDSDHADGERKTGWRQALVVTEIALALLLLSAAGLLFRSFATLYRVDPGFPTERLAVVRLFLQPRAMDPGERIDFFGRLAEHLAAVPGVDSAGGSSVMPLSRIRLERFASYSTSGSERIDAAPQAELRISTHGYLPALAAPRIAGRFFDAHDLAGTRPVAVVNQTLARQAWPGESPVGRRLSIAFGDEWQEREVIGVVGDVRYRDLASAPRPAVYVPHTQMMSTIGMQYVLRTSADPAALLPTLERAVLDFHRTQPAHSLTTLDAILVEALAKERFATLLMGIFATMAVLLAAVGTYAVLAFAVGRRLHEIAIRMALGARPRQIYSLIVRQTFALAGAGIALGLTATLLSGRVLESQLFGVSASDPATLAVVAAGLVVVIYLAGFLPARWAMAVDPLPALQRD